VASEDDFEQKITKEAKDENLRAHEVPGMLLIASVYMDLCRLRIHNVSLQAHRRFRAFFVFLGSCGHVGALGSALLFKKLLQHALRPSEVGFHFAH
jgi:hypothetical protein